MPATGSTGCPRRPPAARPRPSATTRAPTGRATAAGPTSSTARTSRAAPRRRPGITIRWVACRGSAPARGLRRRSPMKAMSTIWSPSARREARASSAATSSGPGSTSPWSGTRARARPTAASSRPTSAARSSRSATARAPSRTSTPTTNMAAPRSATIAGSRASPIPARGISAGSDSTITRTACTTPRPAGSCSRTRSATGTG